MDDNDVKTTGIAAVVVVVLVAIAFSAITASKNVAAKKYESCINAQIASSVDLKCGEIK